MNLIFKNKKILCLFLVIPILFISLAYAGGYVTQLIHNYHVWTSSGGIPGKGTSPELPSAALSSCLLALTIFPYSLWGIFLCICAFGTLIFMIMKMGFGEKGTFDRERNFTYSDKWE